jgi:hypothetical protein
MSKKTVILLVGAVLIVSVLTSGCTFNVGNTTTSPTSTIYTSAKGYSIKYSSDWSKPDEQNNGSMVAFRTPADNKTENLNVVVLNTTDTSATVNADAIEAAEGYNNFTLISAANTTLAGLPAGKIVYTATIDGNQQKILQTWTVQNGKVYVITYKGASKNYDTYLSAAQQMIDSFQIK